MKKILLFISFILCFQFAEAQVKDGMGGYATISAVSLVSGTTYNFTITGFNSNVRPRGQDGYTTLDIAVGCVIWSTDCNKFVIASISSNTGITMVGTMTSIDGAQAPPTNGTRIAVFKEITTNNFTTYSLPPAADGNGANLFGISIAMRACIDAHYRRQDSIAFASVGGVTTASNGLTKVSNDIQSGGALTKNTVTNGASGVYTLEFTNLKSGELSSLTAGGTISSGITVDSTNANLYKYNSSDNTEGGEIGIKSDSLYILKGAGTNKTLIAMTNTKVYVTGIQNTAGVTTDSILVTDAVTGEVKRRNAATIGGSIIDNPIIDTVTLTSHGFTVGTALKANATTKADTNYYATGGANFARWVVGKVIDVNTYIVVSSGKFTSPSHGFNTDSIYYLSNTTAGLPVKTTGLKYSQVLFTVIDANNLFVEVSRPVVNSTFLVSSNIVVSGASTLSLNYNSDYVFTGTTTTWTLPAISSTITGKANEIRIKNRGTGAITLNTVSGATIFDTSLMSTIIINSGESVTILPDGTYFNTL